VTRTGYLLCAVALAALGLLEYVFDVVIVAVIAWALACVAMYGALTHRNGE
jgi:hypothetical protein